MDKNLLLDEFTTKKLLFRQIFLTIKKKRFQYKCRFLAFIRKNKSTLLLH